MAIIFEVIDKTGRKIHLTEERKMHIIHEHPDMQHHFEELQMILKRPLKIVPHEYGNLHSYYSYFKNRKNKSKYLKIVVKYLNNHGFVITAYFVRTIK